MLHTTALRVKPFKKKLKKKKNQSLQMMMMMDSNGGRFNKLVLNMISKTLWLILICFLWINISAQDKISDFSKGTLIYDNALAMDADVMGWRMWEVQNQKTEAGQCIIFFAAKGAKGESIFDPSFPVRDGTFRQYTKSDLFNSYHISYYANGRDAPGREISHLRKNTGFNLVQEVEPGIPIKSKAIHKITLIKEEAHILMFIDGRKIIDWQDDGQKYGPVLREMQWTDFQYRNFQVWDIKK